jgi:hypothetical protein
MTENNIGESGSGLFKYVFQYFHGVEEEHHEESVTLGGLLA